MKSFNEDLEEFNRKTIDPLTGKLHFVNPEHDKNKDKHEGRANEFNFEKSNFKGHKRPENMQTADKFSEEKDKALENLRMDEAPFVPNVD